MVEVVFDLLSKTIGHTVTFLLLDENLLQIM